MQESFSKWQVLTSKKNDHKNLENCPVLMPYNIAERDKAYDKCHHLLNPFKSNEISCFNQMDQSISSSGLLGVVFFILIQNFNRSSCKQTVESIFVYVQQRER